LVLGVGKKAFPRPKLVAFGKGGKCLQRTYNWITRAFSGKFHGDLHPTYDNHEGGVAKSGGDFFWN